ncbi:putative 4-phosphoerythronate dehydrogenase [Monocercomonoides exilis]|uniref:putative 4-phosphoerythronate dehydrogenase n=1 Tax=Monocercomonoides exilis TaxID=2049356 RepID=UPI003559B223|nr:putative 4-phosphoerythronate dehydrogenase [Monocercomonoides exilis]|eukprot:MONOS_7340.1-p1 / transcript=MONOS_7340.1 / gene=MONOS_7340 / organism=Monocercomonoides_exilis_PA203 / gene_product=4-phosphoerythronate dehydrogenase / transcript_product=4-phosphoerythronate dehydrogenase / location=Mono_scaffold00248:76857-78164(-) / protein_length=398 / sequence_SO=supercontig / SO=protein_coding / is_pseudo=false
MIFNFFVCSAVKEIPEKLEKFLKEIEFPFETRISYVDRLSGTDDEIKTQLKSAHVVIGEPHFAHLLSNPEISCPNLRWFQSTAAGLEYFMKMNPCPYFPTFAKLPFVVTRGATFYGPTMAEYCISMMIAVQRSFFKMKEVQIKLDSPYVDRDNYTKFPLLSQLTVGIMGATGSIGQDIARRLYALGCTVIGLCRRKRKEGEPIVTPQVETPVNAHLPPSELCFEEMYPILGDDEKQTSLRTFLSKADVVINVLPTTLETIHLLGGRLDSEGKEIPSPMESCKKSCIFINIGRGTIIKEDVLVDILKKGTISHAVLDVQEMEPLPSSSRLLTELSPDQVTITPHCSGWPQNGDFITPLLKENLSRFAAGMKAEESALKEGRTEEWVPDLLYIMNWKEGY